MKAMSRMRPARVLGCLVLFLALASPALRAAQSAAPIAHSVSADGHALRVWEKSAPVAEEALLLVHGRTWSALPDFDLQVDGEQLSLMDGLVERGYAVYAVDLRGYGQTPRDANGWLTPNRSADDVLAVLDWIARQRAWRSPPHLFGWSRGAAVSQLAAQRRPASMSSLTLFGFAHDPDRTYSPENPTAEPAREPNTPEAAASDFITPDSISRKAIDAYVKAALAADPIRADLRGDSEWKALDPSQLALPTLLIAGEHDPLTPPDRLARFFLAIRSPHKQWVSVPGGDHAAFLEKPRSYFIRELVTFLQGTRL